MRWNRVSVCNRRRYYFFFHNFEPHPRETFAEHPELFGGFFADVDVRATIGDSSVGDPDKDAGAIRQTGDADERAEWKTIVRRGEFVAFRAPTRERIDRHPIPNRKAFGRMRGFRFRSFAA